MSSKAFLLFLVFLFSILMASATDEESSDSIRPVAAFTANVTSGPAPLVVRFTDTGTGGVPTSWHWDTGNGLYSKHAMNATYTFTEPGVYTITLTVTNEAGSDTVSKTDYITVLDPSAPTPTQKPTASFTADVTNGTFPLAVTFTDTSSGGAPTSWYWNFGDGTYSTDAKMATYTFTNPGTYTVTLTVTNDAGSDTVSKTDYITVSASLEAPIANFYSTQVEQAIASGKSLSVPATVIFQDCSTGSPTSWLWDFGDGETSIVQNPTHTYVEAGSHTVILTVTNNAGSNTISKSDYVLTIIKEESAYTQTNSENNGHQTNSENDNHHTATVNNNYQITTVNNNYNNSSHTETDESTSTEKPVPSSASVSLYGEKTNVNVGEDILLKLSAVNLITKPTMHVQVIIIPPSGMSVSSSEFSKFGAGQYTTIYDLEPGEGKDIEVKIAANQVGNFNVNGRIVYYFGENKTDAEDITLDLPIQVKEAQDIPDTQPMPEPTLDSDFSISGFSAASLVLILMIVSILRRN